MDLLAHRLGGVAPEDSLGRSVPQGNAPIAVEQHDRALGGGHHRAEFFFALPQRRLALLPLRDVAKDDEQSVDLPFGVSLNSRAILKPDEASVGRGHAELLPYRLSRGDPPGKRLHHPLTVVRMDKLNEGSARQRRRVESVLGRLRADVAEGSIHIHCDGDVVHSLDQLAVSPVALVEGFRGVDLRRNVAKHDGRADNSLPGVDAPAKPSTGCASATGEHNRRSRAKRLALTQHLVRLPLPEAAKLAETGQRLVRRLADQFTLAFPSCRHVAALTYRHRKSRSNATTASSQESRMLSSMATRSCGLRRRSSRKSTGESLDA